MKKLTLIILFGFSLFFCYCEVPNESSSTEVTGTTFVDITNEDDVVYEIYIDTSSWSTMGPGGHERIVLKDTFAQFGGLEGTKNHSIDIRRTVSGSVIIFDSISILTVSGKNNGFHLITIENGKFIFH